MKRLDKLRRLFPFVVFALTAVLLSRGADAALPMTDATLATSTGTGRPFAAQVVGVEWLNPLQRRDYPAIRARPISTSVECTPVSPMR
jgi:hypothetical protein